MGPSPLDIVVRLTSAVSKAHTLPDIYDAALDGLRDGFDLARASILLFDDAGVMRFVASRGLSEEYRAAVEGHSPWTPGEPAPEPLIVRDVRQDPSLTVFADLFARERIVGLGFFPLVSEGGVIGKFMLYSAEPAHFTPEAIAAARTIGFLLGFAVERTSKALQALNDREQMRQAQAEETELRTRLTTLTDGSLALLTAPSPDSVVEEVLSLADRIIAADAYAVWRRDGMEWYVAGSIGLSERFAAERLPWDHRQHKFDEPIVAPDLQQTTMLKHRLSSYAAERIVSIVSVPLTVRAEPTGSIAFYYRQRHVPSTAELKVAMALGHLSAAAISNAVLYQDAQHATRVKDEFLAMLSHVLRTPLNVILGRVRMIREAPTLESARHFSDAIERNGLTLARLVDDLLDVSRMTVGQLTLERQPVELPAVLAAAIQAVHGSIETKSLKVTVEIPTDVQPVMGDPTRMQQIVWNLLTNAVKFTPSGGTIGVRLWSSDGTVSLSVRDSGDGISSDALPHVFDMFWQADSGSNRRHGGLGLGLSLVRKLVELHGGEVAAASDGPGTGALFTVTLPCSGVSVAA